MMNQAILVLVLIVVSINVSTANNYTRGRLMILGLKFVVYVLKVKVGPGTMMKCIGTIYSNRLLCIACRCIKSRCCFIHCFHMLDIELFTIFQQAFIGTELECFLPVL